MKRRELIGGIFWLAFGIVLCIYSSIYEIGSFQRPETGLMPLLLGILLVILSTAIIVQTARSKAKKEEKEVRIFSGDWKKALLTLVVLIVASLLFDWLGYLLTFFLLCVALMIVGGSKSWKQITIMAFCTTIGIYLCFVVLLKQQLPTGILGV